MNNDTEKYCSKDMSDLDDYESILMCLNVDEEHGILVYINRITKTLYYIDSKECNETGENNEKRGRNSSRSYRFHKE